MSYYLKNYPFNPENLQGSITTNQIKDTTKRYGWNYKINETDNCMNITYNLSKDTDVMFGTNKPMNETCPNITGNLTYDSSNSQNSLWNNSTRRKVIVNNKRN
tara:strand:- start:3527 stop:3835 length:309 start_codon:yes stop_codon:yes gene_type:complete